MQKYTNPHDALHNAFTQAMRSAVKNTKLNELDGITQKMEEAGKQYGVTFEGKLHNQLLMQNGSYSTTVGVFDEKIPFVQRGLGSKRLLSIGMNVNAYDDGTLVLIDEVETGLEPYRISTLINQFREQFKENGQLIMTTHSRSVVCECNVSELCTVTNNEGELSVNRLDTEEKLKDNLQGLIRGEPDSFLCKRIIVCEGKTEIGLLRAFDSYLYKKTKSRLAHYGVGTALGGGGDKFFKLAKHLKDCGYDVCILMDSDISGLEVGKQEAEKQNIPVFSWDEGLSIEEQIFQDFSISKVEELIQIAVEEKGIDHVFAKLDSIFKLEDKPYYISDGSIKLSDTIRNDQKKAIGTLAKNKKCDWFKRIDRGQCVGDVVFEDFDELNDCGFKKTINGVQKWMNENET